MTTSSVTSSTSPTTTTSSATPATTASNATSSAAPNITNILGAGSGIDIQALATSLTEAQRAPAKAVIDKHIAASTANVSGYSAIKYVLGNLQTAFTALKDQSSFNSLTPVNSQPSALSVTAGASATNGTHTVEITQLAAAQRNVSGGYASGTSALNGGMPFNVQLSVHGGVPTSIAVTDATPRGLAYAINQAGLGVNAQIINTGDATSPFKITLTGTSGAANDFTMTSQAMPGTPAITTTQGNSDPLNPVTESSSVSFGSGLSIGQSMTLGGLTYTATNAISASDLAAAFSSLANGATTGAGAANGVYSGSLNGFSTGANNGNAITATSGNANTDVADLAVAGTAPAAGLPRIVTVQGSSSPGNFATESSTITFGSGLSAGQSVTVAGLTYTATSAIGASDLATAFSSLADGATSGPGLANGRYSGTLSGFNTSQANGASFTATSSTPNTNVTDLTLSTSTDMAAVTNLDFSTTTQTASNASLIVDGVAITASSNQVNDAIPGVTLSLTAKTTSGTPATLSFTRDTSNVTTMLQSLVSSYNDAVSMLNVVSDPSSTVADYGASLVGNSIVSQVRGQIRALMLGGAAPNAPASGSIKALRDLGVSIDSKGVLSLDTTQLDTALSSNFDHAVTMLCANRQNQSTYSTLDGGVAGDAVKKLTAMLASTGAISTNSADATTKIASYQKDLAALETRMTALKANYVAQFAAMDSIVGQSSTLRNSMTSTYAGMMSMYTNK